MVRRILTFSLSQMRAILRLGAPLVAVQLGMMLMNIVDAAMVGRIAGQEAAALAAVALANLYLWGVSVLGAGVLFSLDPIISQAVGAGDREAAARAAQRGAVMAVVIGLCVAAAMLPAGWIMTLANQPAELVPIVRTYVWINMAGTVAFFGFIATRQALQAMGHVSAIFWAVAAANVANIALNWTLIYGNLGAPAMGVAGSAWATVVCRWVMLSLLIALSWRTLRPLLRPWRAGALARRPIVRMIEIGLPIGGTMAMEFGAFAFIALVMGAMGPTMLAAHQIALTLAALAFMMPLGIGQAAAVLVGQAIGRGDPATTRRAAMSALLIGGGLMAMTALIFISVPVWLARIYTTDGATIALAAVLIPIAGFFQVFDGLQAVASGVLRGAGDTRAPMLMQMIGMWLIGLPISVVLAFGYGGGAIGLWWGVVAGLGAVAALLCARVVWKLTGPLARLVVDEPVAG